MKSTSIKTVLLLLVLCVAVSACARKLPNEIVNPLDERFDYTSYQIVSYQKAPHPENYPGFGGSLHAKDEAWCVVVETPDWGYSRSIYFRLGNHWLVVFNTNNSLNKSAAQTTNKVFHLELLSTVTALIAE